MKLNNIKDSTESRKMELESFNNIKDSTESRKTIKDSNGIGIF